MLNSALKIFLSARGFFCFQSLLDFVDETSLHFSTFTKTGFDYRHRSNFKTSFEKKEIIFVTLQKLFKEAWYFQQL